MTKRRTWIALGGVLGILLLLVLGAWLWWAPGMVRARFTEAVQARLGMKAEVGGVGLRPTAAVLDDVVITAPDGGIRIEIEELRASASPWDVITGAGAAAVDDVVARRVSVQLDTSHEGFDASLRGLRAAIAGRDAPEEGADVEGGRSYEAIDVRVEIRDDEGPWLEVDGARLLKRPEAVEADASSARLGRAPSDEVSLESAALRLLAADGGWRVARLWAASADITRGAPVDGEPSTGERIRTLAATARASTDADDEPAPDEAAPDEATPDEEADAKQVHPAGLLARLFDRLTPDADLGVDSLTVRSRSDDDGDGQRTILRGLEASLRGEGEGAFRARGSGKTADRGTLTWDLELEPGAARIEGRVGFEQLPLALLTPFLPDLPWHRPERTRLGGELVIEAKSATRFSVDGRVGIAELALSSERIAPEPIAGLSLRMEGEGVWHAAERRLQLDSARIVSGKAAVDLKGTVELADHYLFDLRADMEPTRCRDAIAAIPTDLLGGLRGFSWEGKLGAYVLADIDSRELDEARLDIRVADGCEFVTVPAVADLRRFDGPFEHEVREPDGTTFRMTTGPGTANWVPIRTVSPFLIQAIIAHEDAGFFRHHGFATWAIEEAVRRNLKAGRFVLGASTISMQLAKNLFLKREKTLARKVQEVILTWWLERALDKRDILELYVNVIEYGPDIYGIRHAAQHYFGREPVELGPAESAFLACILPAPKRYHHHYEEGALSQSMKNRVRRHLEHMHAKGRLDRAALDYALAELESLRFHRPGDPPPEPRDIPGGTGPLPFRVGEGRYDVPTGPYDDGGDPLFDPSGPDPDPGAFEEVPEVDPDAL